MPHSRLFLVDDHPIVLNGVRHLLESHGHHVLGTGKCATDALPVLEADPAGMLVMDVAGRTTGGVEAAGELLAKFSTWRLIVYTGQEALTLLPLIRQTGAAGLVFKEDDPHELVTAIDIVERGGLAYGRYNAHLLAPLQGSAETVKPACDAASPLTPLTPRERDIFWLLARGASVKSAAQTLCISSKTVETHKYNIFTKLAVNSTIGLVKLAVRHGLSLEE